jgi:hypothetical protein
MNCAEMPRPVATLFARCSRSVQPTDRSTAAITAGVMPYAAHSSGLLGAELAASASFDDADPPP